MAGLADIKFQPGEAENIRRTKLALMLQHLSAAELVTLSSVIAALASLTPAADQVSYWTSSTAAALTGLTAFARTILDDPDAPTVRATIGAAAASHTHTASEITDFSEAVDDRAASLLVAGTNISLAYNDVAGTLTVAATGLEPSIAAGTTAQYWRGDKTWATLNAAAVAGLAPIATSGSASDLSTGTVPAARMPAHTGDATSTAGSVALTLATVNVNTGTYGGATTSPQISVDGKGRITGVTAVTITPAASSITGAGDITKTDDTNVTLTLGGTPAGSALKAVSFTLGWTGALAPSRGGTGLGSYTIGDTLYASASGTLAKLAAVATGNVLISGGVATAPSWGKVGLTTHVSGTLGTGNGGTGVTSLGDITRTNDTNVTLTLGGTPTGAVVTSTSFTLGWSGTLAVTRGGLGFGTTTQGDILYADAANSLAKLAKSATATRYLANTGTSNNPAWDQVNLANGVTGTLPVGNGGTGDTGGAWTTYTPTVTAFTGSFTSVSATGYYKQLGKTVFVQIEVTITTNGTAALFWSASLPVAAAARRAILTAKETAVTGFMGTGQIEPSSSVVVVVKYDGLYLGANSYRINISGEYEAA